MDLDEVIIDTETQVMFEDINAGLERLRGLGAFTPEARELILREFLPDRISDTLIIESVYVDARLTRAILDGQAIHEIDSHGIQSVENVRDASELVRQEADFGSAFSVALLREINRRIQHETGESAEPGAYRKFDVTVSGAAFQPPSWATIESSMDLMTEQLNASTHHPLIMGAWAHWVVARVHPFQNGNGRTARLVQDFFLLRGGLLPVGIPSGRRREYYDALAWADENEDLSLLSQMIADAELSALQKAFEFGSQQERTRKNVRLLAQRADRSKKTRDEEQYQLWLTRTDAMATSMRRVIDQFNSEVSSIRLKMQVFEQKTFAQWQEVRREGWAEKTWFLTVKVFSDYTHRFTLIFYFKRHVMNWIQGPSKDLKDSVVAFLTIQEPNEKAMVGYPLRDNFVSLREIAFLPNGYRVFREGIGSVHGSLPRGISATTESPLWDFEDVSSLDPIIEELVSQVLDKLGVE